ncbi:MAG TPA: hypothetical protein VLA99_10325 [Nitrospiraceae bacterium]|nr:hypothetical protein [Nitrospiraceae bacterium]
MRCDRLRSWWHSRPLGMVGLGLIACLTPLSSAPAQVTLDQQIELKIHDYRFVQVHVVPLHPGFPAEIVVTNEDNVRHGFTSPFFLGLHLEGEGEGVVSYGKGLDGFYLDPGKTLTIRFIMPQPGRFTFRCDIHKDMEGEIYLLEIPVA